MLYGDLACKVRESRLIRANIARLTPDGAVSLAEPHVALYTSSTVATLFWDMPLGQLLS